MRIALDFDDVIVDTEEYKRGYFADLGITLSEGYVSSALVEDGLISQEHYRMTKEAAYLDRERSLEMLLPRVGAVEGIRRLQQLGHTVEIVTARSEVSLGIAQAILQRQGLSLNMHGVGYGSAKTEQLQDFDVFIDDDPKHLLPLLESGISLFLMSTKENADFDHPGITRVNSWEEFLGAVLATEA